jgi:hypothetical protein
MKHLLHNGGTVHYGGCDITYAIEPIERAYNCYAEEISIEDIEIVDVRELLETVERLPGDTRDDLLQRLIDEHWSFIEPLISCDRQGDGDV